MPRLTRWFNLAFRLAPLILVVEAILLSFCPPIGIFGFNPLRQCIADLLVPWLGHTGYHLSGVITDFKKIVLYYACLYCQLILFKAIVRPETAAVFAPLSDDEFSRGIRLGLEVPNRFVRAIVPCVSALLAVAAFLFVNVIVIGYLWILPSLTDHVFGSIGKGLISSWWRTDITLPSHLFLVAYRAWYITATLFVGTTATLSVYFTVLRAVELLVRSPEHDPKVQPRQISEWTVTFGGTPLLAFSALCLLLSLSSTTGIGELSGRPLEVATYAFGFLAAWLVIAMLVYVALAKRRNPGAPLAVTQFVRFFSGGMMLATLAFALSAAYVASRQAGSWAGTALKQRAALAAARDVIVIHVDGRLDLADELWTELHEQAGATIGSEDAARSDALIALFMRRAPATQPSYRTRLTYDRSSLREARPKVLWDYCAKIGSLGYVPSVGTQPNVLDDLLTKRLAQFDAAQPLPPARSLSDWVGMAVLLLFATAVGRGLRLRAATAQ